MNMKQCKGFNVVIADETVYIETKLQKFRLRARGNRRIIPADAVLSLDTTSTMVDLVGLFYLRDEDGYATKQVLELVVDNFDARVYE